MPCSDGDYGYNEASISLYKDRNNELAAENDMLRENVLFLIKNLEARGIEVAISSKLQKTIEAEQIKHRKVDLERLKKYFTKKRDAEKLGLVMLADPHKPLAEQLGFDPDEY